MDNFARRVECSGSLPKVFLDKILEDLPEHFRIDSDFLLKWLSFVHREVEAIKYIQDAGAGVAFTAFYRIEKQLVRNG